VCFFTDGLVEARSGGELFGTQRLTDALVALGAGATAEDLLEQVVKATDRRPDDMAACLLRLDGARELAAHAASGNGAQQAALARTEELEIDRAALRGERVSRFLEGAGLPEARVAEATRAAGVVVGSAGEAVLRVHMDGGRTETEVVPHNTGVLHLAERPGPDTEAQLLNG
jgi:uncharacterized protein with ACT and thioredoxin-like domain